MRREDGNNDSDPAQEKDAAISPVNDTVFCSMKFRKRVNFSDVTSQQPMWEYM
jgi:hypothetical protein